MGELAEEAIEYHIGLEPSFDFDETTQWETKDGQVLEISDMKISHIINVVNMLKRKGLNNLIPKAMKIRIINEDVR